MSQIPLIASIDNIKKQLRVVKSRIKVLTQYAALNIADKDIYILLEAIYGDLQALSFDDFGNIYDRFANVKADFMVLAQYEGDASDHDFGDSMFSLSEKFEAVTIALDNRVDFECAVNRLQAVGASCE